MYVVGLKSFNSQSDKLIQKFIHSFNINKMCKFIQMNIIKTNDFDKNLTILRKPNFIYNHFKNTPQVKILYFNQ